MSYGIAVASAHPVDRSADGALSIIVVTFNSSPVVTELLDSIQERLNGAEIIVCDNGSTDGTIDLAQSHASRPRVVAIGKNLGFGAAANAGARAATASLLLVINPDSRIVDVRREPLAVLAAQRPFGIRACAIETGKGRVHLLHERWGWRRELAWNLWRAFLNPRWVQLGRPKSRREPRNPWVSGAAFLVRRDEFLEIGGFDERYFLYGEDIDLSATYAQAALPVTRTSAIAVEHEGGGSSGLS
jgi:GT2 family glycosyltransferase